MNILDTSDIFTPGLISRRLSEAYAELRAATVGAQLANTANSDARHTLEQAKNAILYANRDDAKALGSNEAARAATIAEMTATERAGVEETEALVTSSRDSLTLAQMEYDYWRTQLRTVEAAIGWKKLSVEAGL